MAFHYRSPASAPIRGRSPDVVFAVGRRVFVSCATARASNVALTDDAGAVVCGNLRDGAEVEILAWRPLGSQGTRYLVRSSSKGIEGWLGTANLRRLRAKTAGVAVASTARAPR